MSQKYANWQNLLQHTRNMSLYDKKLFLKADIGTENIGVMIKLGSIIAHEENEMKKGSCAFYAMLVDSIKDEITAYIMIKHRVTKEVIEKEIENTHKMLAHAEGVFHNFCIKFGLANVDDHYGTLKYLLLKDYDRIKSPINVVWVSIFSFLWLLSMAIEGKNISISNADIVSMFQQIYHITGIHEFKIFVTILLCSHQLFGILPREFASMLELVVNIK